MGLEPTTILTVSLLTALTTCAKVDYRLSQNWFVFIGMKLNYWPCLIGCVGFGLLVALSTSDIS